MCNEGGRGHEQSQQLHEGYGSKGSVDQNQVLCGDAGSDGLPCSLHESKADGKLHRIFPFLQQTCVDVYGALPAIRGMGTTTAC